MSAANPPISYGKLWVVLVALVGLGAAFLLVPNKTLAVFLIFAVATIKAVIVIRHYMHVVHQPLMVYAMLGVPLILAFLMVFLLIPDIAANSPMHQHGIKPPEHGSAH